MLRQDFKERLSAEQTLNILQDHMRFLERCPPMSSKELALLDKQWTTGVKNFSTHGSDNPPTNIIGNFDYLMYI
jgi:hypothetical protein